MDNPRADKVAVVDEVRERLGAASASVVTEYRGLTVTELAELRQSLAAAGGDYKIFKNTLVRLAIADSPHQSLSDLLSGPTAIAFVRGDVSAVAKALRDFGRTNPHLIIKGGLLDGGFLSPAQLGGLAELPSRDVLLARMAGAIAAPLTQMAGLLKAIPQNLAYGISALVDQRRAANPQAADPPEAPPDTATAEAVCAAEWPAGGTTPCEGCSSLTGQPPVGSGSLTQSNSCCHPRGEIHASPGAAAEGV